MNVNFTKGKSFVFSILGGFLLYLSFTQYFFFLVFTAYIPLFLLTHNFYHEKINGLKFILFVWISFLIWNGFTTWWISLASFGGALMAIIANSIIMCIVYCTPFILQKKLHRPLNFYWLIPFWISFEYLHFHWDLMWPWLTLGNVFAFFPYLAQWYEVTGTSGGSLWILTTNILITQFVLYKNKAYMKNIITLVIVPIMLSVSIWIFRYKELQNIELKNKKLNVLIVQPNVDPYNDKFYIEPLIQTHSMYQQIKSYLHDTLDVILLPETFITENIYEGTSKDMLQYPTLKFLYDSILSKYPNISIITGANTFKIYSHQEIIPATARQNNEGLYYDIFNTALCVYRDSIQMFHKSKLVPGVEKMPYPALFKPLEKLAINLGGTTGSLGRQAHPSLLYTSNHTPIATVICYESVFSDFVSKFFKLGANTLFVITNDGWWGNTPGYYQHFIFGRLRAIENRTYIARSANTGISAIINPLGEIKQHTSFWTQETLLSQIPLVLTNTIYSKIGDTISPICIVWMAVLIIYSLIKNKLFTKYKNELLV